MLIAMDAQHQLVNAATADRQIEYYCPECVQPVRLKRGAVIVPHFAHVHATDCDAFSEGETTEHLRGKKQLATWFAASGYTVRLEAGLPEIHQRPDILVRRGTAQPLALEFQCSPLSVERLAARTQGYRQHGYQVLWLLGRPYQRQLHLNSKALKFLQYQQRWGLFLLFLDTQSTSVRLLHHVLTLDTEPLTYQTIRLDTRSQSVLRFRQLAPKINTPTLPDTHLRHYYQQLMLARLRHQRGFDALQVACYQRDCPVTDVDDAHCAATTAVIGTISGLARPRLFCTAATVRTAYWATIRGIDLGPITAITCPACLPASTRHVNTTTDNDHDYDA